MARRDVANARSGQATVELDRVHAWDAEDGIYPVALQERHERLADGRHARQTGRVTLKSGGRTIWIDARTFDWAEAAGNYVEVRAAGRSHLARIGLAALEAQLREAGLDVVRIHRSFLVNRGSLQEVQPLGDGDFQVKTKDGAILRGSRRYRRNLEA